MLDVQRSTDIKYSRSFSQLQVKKFLIQDLEGPGRGVLTGEEAIAEDAEEVQENSGNSKIGQYSDSFKLS